MPWCRHTPRGFFLCPQPALMHSSISRLMAEQAPGTAAALWHTQAGEGDCGKSNIKDLKRLQLSPEPLKVQPQREL